MQLTIYSLFFVLAAACTTTALPILQLRDVYDPPITFPQSGSTFMAGDTFTVTWYVSAAVWHMLYADRTQGYFECPAGLAEQGRARPRVSGK